MSNDHPTIDARIDDALASSFPASDPPSWTLGAPEWASTVASRNERSQDLLQRLRGDHANVAGLLLVVESLLARLHGGEAVDRALLIEVVRYTTAYLRRVHEPREARALATIATEVPLVRALEPVLASNHEDVVVAAAALEGAIDVHAVPAWDLVRKGFAFTRALRTRIGFEESVVLALAALAPGTRRAMGADDAAVRIDDEYRARFEAVTARVGCGCSFE